MLLFEKPEEVNKYLVILLLVFYVDISLNSHYLKGNIK